ncbi:hypothetical protein BS47DRAFT_494576 [Hydnum rufescens UP504]|uniref:Uncharacterized protein n=1 Tax=Hydnum rufescens UP504 TaxID=1448309 RepID=A0A9P6AHB9_9AGAM|nr:hypothetical protein BS47DRAFT_494576 [Hydnum rufescens UP504]
MYRTVLCLFTLFLSIVVIFKTTTLMCRPSSIPTSQYHHDLSRVKSTTILGAYATIRDELDLGRMSGAISPLSSPSRNFPLRPPSSPKERLEIANMVNFENEHRIEARGGIIRGKHSRDISIGAEVPYRSDFGPNSEAANEGPLPVLHFAIDSLAEPRALLDGVVRAYKWAIRADEERAMVYRNCNKGLKERDRHRGSTARRFCLPSPIEARRSVAGRGMARRLNA